MHIYKHTQTYTRLIMCVSKNLFLTESGYNRFIISTLSEFNEKVKDTNCGDNLFKKKIYNG